MYWFGSARSRFRFQIGENLSASLFIVILCQNKKNRSMEFLALTQSKMGDSQVEEQYEILVSLGSYDEFSGKIVGIIKLTQRH